MRDSAELSLPASPPTEVLDAIGAAAERAAELRSENRELHFRKDEASGRVIVQVRDLAGNVIRTIPPSSALDDHVRGAHLHGVGPRTLRPRFRRRHQLDRRAADDARAPGPSRMQNRQYAASGMQTALKDIASKLVDAQDRRRGAHVRRDLEADAERRVLRHHARRVTQTGGAGIGGHIDPGQPPRRPRRSAASRSRAARPARSRSRQRQRPDEHDVDRGQRDDDDAAARRRDQREVAPAPSSPRSSRTPPTRTAWSSPRARPARSPTSTSRGGVTSEDATYATPDLTKLDAEYSLDGVTKTREDQRPGERRPGPAHHAQGRRPPRRRRSASASPRSTATRSRPRSRRSSTPTTRSSTPRRAEMTEKPISNPDERVPGRPTARCTATPACRACSTRCGAR